MLQAGRCSRCYAVRILAQQRLLVRLGLSRVAFIQQFRARLNHNRHVRTLGIGQAVRLRRLRQGQHALDAILEPHLVDRGRERQPGIAGDDVDRIPGGFVAALIIEPRRYSWA
jgi:hypothetical protein